MRKLLYCFILAIFALPQIAGAQAPAPGTPSVLLELFSSEGCSSCPEADAFAQEILRLSDSSNSPVYVIDYHVDIWNKSGWVDSFSTPEFSKRQSDYMKKVHQEAMFTPMMFVNGQYGMPAGAKKEIGQAIYKELVTAATINLSLNASMLSNGKGLHVSYTLTSKSDSIDLMLILVQKEAISKVTAGGNAGKTLTHHHVARKMYTVPVSLQQSGFYEIPIDDSMKLSDYILVGFVQHQRTWKVLSTDMLYFR